MSNTINTNNNTNNFYNSIFGNNNNSNQSTSFGSNILSDYASIRNGSYGKLLKNYYAKQNKANSTDSSEDAKKTKNEMSQIKSDSKGLADAATELYSNSSLFEKKEITKTDSEGKETKVTDYDRDEIKKKINAFVESYNSLIKDGGESDDKSVLRRTLNTVNRTKANSKMLEKVGISIGKDNTLKVDEDKLSSASISDLKALFSGRGSYAYGIASNASAVTNYTSNKISDSSLYTQKATTYEENKKSSLEDYI